MFTVISDPTGSVNVPVGPSQIRKMSGRTNTTRIAAPDEVEIVEVAADWLNPVMFPAVLVEAADPAGAAPTSAEAASAAAAPKRRRR
ncbi:hypothetical protein ACGF12_36960 [Kitasatospora sp. NPDC048296]|uniref:hypothetical protein n=1 Tax=Kitasatospora sp. NPDC048296 TaxID=3364048 RepID=UPI0037239D25